MNRHVPILITVAALGLTACTGSDGGTALQTGTAKQGDTLTFAVGSDAGCVDPQQVASNDTI